MIAAQSTAAAALQVNKMNNYLFKLLDTADADYTLAVAFSLPAYDASRLHHLRQAFPGFVAAYRHDQLVGVCGFRSGARGLFLEQFMEQPADAYVSLFEGLAVARAAIVEIGAFRVKSASLTPFFAANIQRLLLEQGFSHALALSSTMARSIEAWTRERAAIAGGKLPGGGATATAPLGVSVIPLAL